MHLHGSLCRGLHIYLVRHELYAAWEGAIKAAGMCYHWYVCVYLMNCI